MPRQQNQRWFPIVSRLTEPEITLDLCYNRFYERAERCGAPEMGLTVQGSKICRGSFPFETFATLTSVFVRDFMLLLLSTCYLLTK